MPPVGVPWEPKRPSTGKSSLESEEANRTIVRGEEILDHAKEVARTIEERIHHVIAVCGDEAVVKTIPNTGL